MPGGLRTLYVVEELDEIEPRALWADSKLGFDVGLRHRDAWVRSAIVTDIAWMARAARMFAWMIPGEARIFRSRSSTRRRPGSRATQRPVRAACHGNPPAGPGANTSAVLSVVS